jgi:hypothetical protein
MKNFTPTPFLATDSQLKSKIDPSDIFKYKKIYALHFDQPVEGFPLGTTSSLLSHGDYYKMTYDTTYHMLDVTFTYRTYFSAFQLQTNAGKQKNQFYLESKIILRRRPTGVYYFEIDIITNTGHCDFKLEQEFNKLDSIASRFDTDDWNDHNKIWTNKQCIQPANDWYNYTLDIYAMAILKDYVAACYEDQNGNNVWSGTQWDLVMRA